MSDDLLGRKQACELLKIGRSTLYEWMANDPTFPKPTSRPRTRVKFKRTEVERWLAAQRPATDLHKWAHSPRKHERERRRRAAETEPRDVTGLRRAGFQAADEARLRARLAPVDTRRSHRRFPGLRDVMDARRAAGLDLGELGR